MEEILSSPYLHPVVAILLIVALFPLVAGYIVLAERKVLADIQVPALVVAAERDTFTPLSCSQEMADVLPLGELFVLADASHAALIEQPETIGHRLERFLTERLSPWPDETAAVAR